MNILSKKLEIDIIILNFLISLIPISFIIGNLAINVLIVLIIIFSFLFYRKKIFDFKHNFIDKLILIFFCYSFLLAIYKYFIQNYYHDIYVLEKSIFYLRFYFFYISLRYLVINKKLKFDLFFYTSSVCVIFVSLDIIYQLIYGKDIFGFPNTYEKFRKISGPFKDELIAGGYLQRFSIFMIVPFLYFLKNFSKTFVILSFFLIFTLICIGLILSGNRMPLVLFLFIMFFIGLSEKDFRKYTAYLLGCFIVLFSLIYNQNLVVKKNFNNFADRIYKFHNLISSEKLDRHKLPQHFAEFESFYDTWLMNKFLGGGIKSFRINCPLRKNISKDERVMCSNHPHNYYLEVISELGVVGLVIFSFIVISVLKESYLKRYLKNDKKNINILPFIFLFIAEIFPIKSTGSFFTTSNSTYFFFITSILVTLSMKNLLIENKKIL